jgi:hypothetical protein
MNTVRCLFGLPLCLALVACDSQPDVRLMIHAPQPLAHDCLEQLPSHLSSQVPLAQVRRPRPNEGVEYEVREHASRISIFQDFATNIIEVSLTSEGSPSPDQRRASLGLLKDMHHGVLGACNLDPAKVQVERSCSGDSCKDPAYPDL